MSTKLGFWIAGAVIVISIGVIGYQLWRYTNIPPQLSFEYTQAVKVGQEVRFINTSSHIDESGTWTWNFGDQAPEEHNFSAIHAYPSTGTYGVTLTYESGGETYSKRAAIVVTLPFPEAAFEIEGGEYQVGQDIPLTNTSSGAIEYIWQFGNGVSSDDSEPKLTFDQPGNYTISLIAINEIGQLDEYSADLTIQGGQSSISKASTEEVLIKHIAVFDERGLSKALTDLANNEVSRSDKRKIRNDILKDVASLGIMINEMTLENYLNKIQLEASSKQVSIIVNRIERNNNNKISAININ